MIEAEIGIEREGFSLDVDFRAEGGVTALFGPSGSGKTTILNAIAGLERPQRGCIVADGEVFFDAERGFNMATRHRRVGYVFQDALLFPHLTARQNLLYGARAESEFEGIVSLLGIEALLSRRPARLSGGERQRVAIGRALLSKPRILLLDEPLASLDVARRQEILPYIEMLRDQYQLPILYVSHAVDEVARLADQVLVIEAGRIVARGRPEEALAQPHGQSRFERISILHSKAGRFDEHYGLTTLEHPAGAITIAGHVAPGRDIRVVIRATDVALSLAPPQRLSVRTALKGRVTAIERDAGPIALVTIGLEGGRQITSAATAKAIDEMKLSPGVTIWCLIKAVSIDERWMALG